MLLLMMKVMTVMTVKVLLEVKVLVEAFVLLLKALLKVFSLSSPLTRTQTTTPQTHPCGA